eukprot:symbB.v1.2.029956.t1/scaffold3328.1/size58959/1
MAEVSLVQEALHCCRGWIHQDRDARLRAFREGSPPCRVLESSGLEVVVIHDEERSQVRLQKADMADMTDTSCGIRWLGGLCRKVCSSGPDR